MKYAMNPIAHLALAFAIVALAGCASSPSKTGDQPAPTYTEKVSAGSLDFVKASNCPHDSMWEKLEWKKITALANACVKAKDWNRVEKMGNFLATHAYLTPWGAYYLSLSAANRKDYQRATWMLELALKKAPSEGLFHYQLGRLHWEQGDDALALKSLKTAADLNPSLTDAHWIMGQVALQRGDTGEAERYLKKALSNDPQHWSALMSMAALKNRTKDWQDSADYLQKAINVNPRSSKARLALAQVQEMQLKRLADALQTYRDLRRLNSDHKLDEGVHFNIDEKIKNIESNLVATQKTAHAPKEANNRKPSTAVKEKR
jgi:tetratricopeptide (TPR) repeat protein